MPNKDVILYLDGSNPPPVVVVTEADTAWTFRFTVMYQNAIYAPNVANVVLAGHKPDGNAFAFLGSKSGNVFTVACNVQMTAVPGDVLAALHLLGGGNTAIPFILRVQPGGGGTAPVASASALTAYATILNRIGNFPPNLAQYVSDWLTEHISGDGSIVVDDSLTVLGAAADAKATGDRIAALESGRLKNDGTDVLSDSQKAAIRHAIGAEAAGTGLSSDVKSALLACFEKVAWINGNGQAYYTALYNALYPDNPISGDDSSMSGWSSGSAYRNVTIVENEYAQGSDGAIISYSGWNRTGYVPCYGASTLVVPPLPQNTGRPYSNWFYDEDHNPVSGGNPSFMLSTTESTTVTVPAGARYFIISSNASALAACVEAGIVPYA